MKAMGYASLLAAFVVNVAGYQATGNKWCVLIASAVAVFGVLSWRKAK